MLKIISGAQTGVDRAALDAALSADVPCGGWCPEGRKAEDGIIPDLYPVQELQGGGYRQRTRKNVIDSDGTVIIYFGQLSGGTELTLRYCMSEKRPYLLIDAEEVPANRAAQRINEFFVELKGNELNFAGPRSSNVAHAYDYTIEAVNNFISDYKNKV
jgi:hypothetical protein